MSESAVSAKPLLVYGLARNRRSPKRPPEPRPSGVHPEEGAVEESRAEPPRSQGLMGSGSASTRGGFGGFVGGACGGFSMRLQLGLQVPA